jgi:hypothetical protein
LDTGFARRFVNYDTTNAYKSDSAFKLNFKGFEVRVNEGGSPQRDALAYYNLDDNSHTKLTFYCRVQTNGKTDTIAPAFTYTNDPHANIIRRTPANGYLTNVTNGTLNDDKLYFQTSPGSYTTVKIPQLDTFSNCIVHRAELIADIYPSAQNNIYTPPQYLFVEALSTNGDSLFTIRNDFSPVSNAMGYDPLLLGGKLTNNQYSLLLTRYVQSIVTKKFPNYTLQVSAPFTSQPYYLLPNTNTPSASKTKVIVNIPVASGRVVVYGGASTSEKKMRLRIIYSPVSS